MTPRRVVITGVGPVSAAGTGREAFFQGLKAGRPGSREITGFDTEAYPSHTAAELTSFDADDHLESRKAYLDRASELALSATALALRDAALDLDTEDRRGVDLLFGSAFGSLDTMALFFEGFLEKGPRFVKPFLFPHTYSNTAISLAAIEYGLNGHHLNFSAGFVSSAMALMEGFDRIRRGASRIALAGGYEALNDVMFSSLCATRGPAPTRPDGTERCAPFDRQRNGYVVGEGAGILVLEERDHAVERDAPIYAELEGIGTGADSGISAPGPAGGKGVLAAMQAAAAFARADAPPLDHVSAAANGSEVRDRHEAHAIAEFLDGRRDTPLISSIKPALGETLGAATALQVIGAAAEIRDRFIPPTLNLTQPEEGLELNLLAGHGIEKDVHRVMVNAVDPGGSAVSLVLCKAEAGGTPEGRRST